MEWEMGRAKREAIGPEGSDPIGVRHTLTQRQWSRIRGRKPVGIQIDGKLVWLRPPIPREEAKIKKLEATLRELKAKRRVK